MTIMMDYTLRRWRLICPRSVFGIQVFAAIQQFAYRKEFLRPVFKASKVKVRGEVGLLSLFAMAMPTLLLRISAIVSERNRPFLFSILALTHHEPPVISS